MVVLSQRMDVVELVNGTAMVQHLRYD